ncbi:hypothetical protein C9I50_27370, partial [Pseudomonas prosekii]|uniref:hypothetical protein n=1 Tax=Pseudomonas prosekii TaxID=1148509 RepID=UPI000D62229D
PAFGGEAVAKSANAVFQLNLAIRVYDGCAAGRRLRQLLQDAALPMKVYFPARHAFRRHPPITPSFANNPAPL